MLNISGFCSPTFHNYLLCITDSALLCHYCNNFHDVCPPVINFNFLRKRSACSFVTRYSPHSCLHISLCLVSPSYHLHSSHTKQGSFASPVQLSIVSTLFAQWLQRHPPHGIAYSLRLMLFCISRFRLPGSLPSFPVRRLLSCNKRCHRPLRL